MVEKVLPNHIKGLSQYLSQPNEKANEDLALTYFRHLFPTFSRQSDACGSDGYVRGHFVLELKGKITDWYSGLFQGLAYKTKKLDFSVIIVATKGFLGIWKVDDIPSQILEECFTRTIAPNKIGKELASTYKNLQTQIFNKAIWCDEQIYDFFDDEQSFLDKIKSFEKTLNSCQKVRIKITITNFTTVLKQLAKFFDQKNPIKAVAGFYSMIYSWDEDSIVELSHRDQTQASLRGDAIKYLIPGKRIEFKKFVENYYIDQTEIEDLDKFFAHYDKALDSVDKGFRVKHGVYFTDLDLSKFVMWFVKQRIPDLGKNYIVIDPACGSGNLVSNWKSPLELRHKIVSEIEPDLLFAVDKRLKKDPWHAGRFTVIPKVESGEGLNFLDKSAKDYIDIIENALKEKGKKFDKPIAFLCNPPYRGDDDTSAESIDYLVHPTIIDCIGKDAKAERYCCFLAQMKLICDQVMESGLPGDSRLLLFTKSAWLTNRASFNGLYNLMLSSFNFVDGGLFNGEEFFDLKARFPVAFTIWSYKPNNLIDTKEHKYVILKDFTWITKKQLSELPWQKPDELEEKCISIVNDIKSINIAFGLKRMSMRSWVGQPQKSFQRTRRKIELNNFTSGGLPIGDERLTNKTVYGESDGEHIGFMDETTPCRIGKCLTNVPWFRLDTLIMDCKRTRCFSAPSDQKSYCAYDIESAYKVFFWYAISRTFFQIGYPIWADAEVLWAPQIPKRLEKKIKKYIFAIGFAENECIETIFPANNPVKGNSEIHCINPMAPNNPDSFWSKTLAHEFLNNTNDLPSQLVNAVYALYAEWKKKFTLHPEINVSYQRPYFIGEGSLTPTSGIVQIKDYAKENDDSLLLEMWRNIQNLLKSTKQSFYQLLTNSNEINYFGSFLQEDVLTIYKEASIKFNVNESRLILGTMIVKSLFNSKDFGKTKFAKVFYIADMMSQQNLRTKYYRELAGPIDYNLLYGDKSNIEKLAQEREYFTTRQIGEWTQYIPGQNIDDIEKYKTLIFGKEIDELDKIINKFKKLDRVQAEVVATLFACWNDLLIDKKSISDELIISEFLNNWHHSKTRFNKNKLINVLAQMKQHSIIPKGIKGHTHLKLKK